MIYSENSERVAENVRVWPSRQISSETTSPGCFLTMTSAKNFTIRETKVYFKISNLWYIYETCQKIMHENDISSPLPLENIRYMEAKLALLRLTNSGKPVHDRQENFDTLLAEHLKTQISLQFSGVGRLDQPSKLKDINRVFFPEGLKRDKSKPLAVHIIGMPRSGKTTLIEKVFGEISQQNPSVQLLPEVASPIKRLSQERVTGLDYSQLVTSLVIAYTTEFHLYLKGIPYGSVPEILLVDRGPIDILPFNKANFMYGRFDAQSFSSSTFNVNRGISNLNDFDNAVVMFLVSPKESLGREGPRESYGMVMHPRFLPVLYEQYLRFHRDLRGLSLPGLEKPFAYACLDASGPTQEVTERAAMLVLEVIERFYKK